MGLIVKAIVSLVAFGTISIGAYFYHPSTEKLNDKIQQVNIPDEEAPVVETNKEVPLSEQEKSQDIVSNKVGEVVKTKTDIVPVSKTTTEQKTTGTSLEKVSSNNKDTEETVAKEAEAKVAADKAAEDKKAAEAKAAADKAAAEAKVAADKATTDAKAAIKTKIAIFNYKCLHPDIPETIAAARQPGLDYIELLKKDGENIIEVRETKCSKFVIIMEDK